MLENIVRHIEMGEGVMEASLKGSREIGFTIVSMTISLAAVFIPVLFMGGIVGRLFHEFAVAIGASILVSGFISLSLTPMLCSRFLKPHEKEEHGKLYQLSERGFDWMLRVYERGLKWSLSHRPLVLGFSLLVLIAMVPLFMAVPKGFLPSEDVNMLIAFTESQEGISFDALVKNQKQAAEVIKNDPNVQEFMSSAGSRGATGSNQGIIFMHLKPRKQRALSADEVMNELRPKLAGIPGMRVYLQNPPPIRIGGQLTKAQYQFTLQDPDTKELYRVAPQLEQKMRGLASMQDVNSDLQLKNPQVQVTIDRDKAAALGVTPIAVETALYTAYGSRQISTIYAPTNEYQVIMELLPEYQSDPSALPLIYVRSSSGSLVPLSAVATLTQDLGPLTIQHAGQLPSVTISFNLRSGHSIGEAVEQVNRLALQTLPATVSTSFQGTAQAFQASLQGLGVLLVLAIAVIYLVLGILYESFIHPLTILSALSLRRLRRAAHAARLPHRDVHLRLRGNHHAGGPGEEERHHDDRLRAGDAAGGCQQDALRGHLRGLRGAVPADHDDHLRGLDGHLAHRAGLRGGRGVAASAGPRGGGRAGLLADADALRDAGVLHVHGGAAGAVQPEGRRGAGAGGVGSGMAFAGARS